ncbi:MAG: phosphate signaling complex protein PhoU [Bacteroidota bacterium]|nr:phosphate signaling complex protein PhoU [Bacteroidota bacterium]MDP4234231.1 phosphate signaling complex protein PhoU [Bacteroidota bacterium]MDP4243421.1 phosphate signaling complex protein PhoU [Bacteroidota bacterium]MDP4288120.1 phosphate signaling complex protein PhoU [Bacteroidota bacterium]
MARVHRHFEDELDTLRSMLIRMGSLVDEQVETAITALREFNEELAAYVVEREARVNELDLAVEAQCQRIFATAQPVAVDLRLLLAAMRMNSDFERIGDIAVNIAERVEPLAGHSGLIERVKALDMIATARQMLTDVINAFIHSDSAQARTVFEKEDQVDALTRETFYNLIDAMKSDPVLIEPAAHLMALLRHVERLADHATNIAEDVVFIAEAKLLRHHGSGQGTL